MVSVLLFSGGMDEQDLIAGNPTHMKVANLMSTKGVMASKTAVPKDATQLLKQYGCGPIPLMGTDGLYERHLLFDNIKSLSQISARERYEAFARSLRDVPSQRWILTEETYQSKNPKRVYYLSMEFLLGRSSANNMISLLLEPFVVEIAKQKDVDLLSRLEEEPDAGLGNGGLGRIRHLQTINPGRLAA